MKNCHAGQLLPLLIPLPFLYTILYMSRVWAAMATISDIGGLWWSKDIITDVVICVHMCLCFLCVPSPVSHWAIATCLN